MIEGRSFQARQAQLLAALAFVEEFCERRGVAPGDMLRLTLIVEELFSNTLKHGHRGDSAAPVHIALELAGARLSLRFEDSAPAFDPLQYLRDTPPALDVALEERPEGKMGLPLVAHLAERFDYAHVDGRNRLQLLLKPGG